MDKVVYWRPARREIVRDYVTDGVDGLLVEPGNPQALRDRIEMLTSDDALCNRLATAALARVRRDHTFHQFAARCLRVMAAACL